jgi:hypothetical protein
VHKALKISTPDDSEGASGPRQNPGKEEGPVVEKDQKTSAEGENEGVQKDNTIPIEENAPNFEKKDDPPINSDNDNKVTANPFPSILPFLLFKLLTVSLKSFIMVSCRMNRKGNPLRSKSSNLHQNHQFYLQLRRMLMKTKALKMMDLARLKVMGSNQRKLMKRKEKESKMGLSLIL